MLAIRMARLGTETASGACGEGLLRPSFASSQENIQKALVRFAEFAQAVR